MSGETEPGAHAAPGDRAEGGWLASLKRSAEELLAEERVANALDRTKHAVSSGGRTVATGLDKARDQFTQEEAWLEVEQTLADLIDVVRVQHARMEALTARLEVLESTPRHA